MECCFRSKLEVEPYRRLHSLQCSKIPRCYGSGTLILTNRAFSPRILLLQHLSDSISLAVKPDQSVLTSFAEIAYAFGTLGATHSAVLARLGLKAVALAWLEAALAFSTHRPGQSHQPGPGLGLARPRPWLLYVKCSNFAHRSVGCTGS